MVYPLLVSYRTFHEGSRGVEPRCTLRGVRYRSAVSPSIVNDALLLVPCSCYTYTRHLPPTPPLLFRLLQLPTIITLSSPAYPAYDVRLQSMLVLRSMACTRWDRFFRHSIHHTTLQRTALHRSRFTGGSLVEAV